MAKHGTLTPEVYSELFPNSNRAIASVSRSFGQYAQVWLDSRNLAEHPH